MLLWLLDRLSPKDFGAPTNGGQGANGGIWKSTQNGSSMMKYMGQYPLQNINMLPSWVAKIAVFGKVESTFNCYNSVINLTINLKFNSLPVTWLSRSSQVFVGSLRFFRIRNSRNSRIVRCSQYASRIKVQSFFPREIGSIFKRLKK